MMKFRGLELDFDIFDEACAEDYERAAEDMKRVGEQKVAGESLAESIRRQCTAIFAYFDTILGEDARKEIFGDRVNLNDCLDAYTEMVDNIDAQKTALEVRLNEMRGGTAVPNRQARRAIKS